LKKAPQKPIRPLLLSLVIGMTLLSAFTSQCYASPSPSDDAWNPIVSNLYYEVWWFDAQTENGEFICCVIAVMGNIEKNATARIDLIIWTADGGIDKVTWFYPFSKFRASAEKLDISVEDSFARETPPFYEVFLSNGTVSCYIHYTAEMPPWKKPKPRPDSYGDWIVIVPKGKVSGWYNIAGKQHEITGIGYHDHMYCLTPVVDGYVGLPNMWGRILGERTVVAFGKAPANYKPVAVFFPDNVYEPDRVIMEIDNYSLKIVGYGENVVIYLKLAISRQCLIYRAKAWEAYRGLISAEGYILTKTFKRHLKGEGIIYFALAV